METKLKSKFMAAVMMFVMLFQICIPVAAIFAKEIHPATVKIISIKNDAGNPLTGTVNMNQTFRVDATFELPDGKITKGDTTTVTLPDEIIFDSSVTAFDLKDKTGNTVATAKREGNKLVVIYNEYVENKSDISGSFYFSVRFNRDKYKDPGKYNLIFDVSGIKINAGEIEYEGTKDLPKSAIAKYGQTKPNAKNTLQFFLSVNRYGKDLNNAVVVDKLNVPFDAEVSGKIIKDSVVIKKGVWEYHEDIKQWRLTRETVVNDKKITVDNDGHTLHIELGNVSRTEGYQIIYDVKMEYDLVNGEIIKNSAEVTSENEPGGKAEFSTAYIESGGQANGYNYSIIVHKVDSNTNESLSDVEFDVIRKTNGQKVGTIKTGSDGTGRIDGLLRTDYVLKETKGLPEYEIPVNAENLVSSSDFDVNSKIAKITVKNVPVKKISVSVEKKWIGPSKDFVAVHLYADDVDTGESATLNAMNGWKATFDNLRQFKADGTEIKYTIKEDVPNDYDSKIIGSQSDGYIITNTNMEKITIPFKKVWVGKEAKAATFELKNDKGEIILTKTVTDEDQWKGEFKDLPKYDKTYGYEITYTLSEVKIDGYNSVISGTHKTGFTVTNTITGKVSIPVTKIWVGKEGISATIHLYADDKKIDSITLNEANKWQHTFTNLEKYKDGNEIKYTIKEDSIENYKSEITGDMGTGFTVKNTNIEKVSVPVMKQWVGRLTDKVEVKLFADNVERYTATLSADTDWKHIFKDLPKYDDKDGHEIVYTVKEEKIEGYIIGVTGTARDGFIITNTIAGKISVPVTKKWIGETLDSIMVNLYADGKKINAQRLSKDNNWHYTFKDLEQYKDGKEITYTIDEEKVNGYTATITGNAKDGYIITNTRDNAILPKTGDETNLSIYAWLIVALGSLFILVRSRKIKHEK